MKKKICFIFGTRPEIIKLAPVILEAQQHPDIEVQIVATGQHKEMAQQMMKIFDLTPNMDLELMRPNQQLADLSGRTLTAVDKALKELQPDWVLVQGDTTTVWAAAVAAFFNRIKVGHVEAGLRTGDKFQPFPEEVNRRLAGAVADRHFAPTEWSKQNLLKENIPDEDILVTGNTVIDTLFWVLERTKDDSFEGIGKIKEWYEKTVGDKRMILITGHRRENFGQGFSNICDSIKQTALRYPDTQLVYPVHLNPNVQKPVHEMLEGVDNIHLIDPLSYAPFVWMMNKSHIILTDSGGVQEEAPSLGKPVLVMREKTERPEGVDAGVVKLVGTDVNVITENIFALMDSQQCYEEMAKASSPYGDGKASQRIINSLLQD